MTDTPTLGPHLLGRLPSPPDERDWQLEAFLGADADLAKAAAAEFKLTTVGYINKNWKPPPPAGTHWAKGMALLAQIGGTPPPPPPPPSGDVKWPNSNPVLNQGQYGRCVGFAWCQWGNTLPVDDHYGYQDGVDVYYEATVLDGHPDPAGQQGATTRSGVKAMQNRGRLTSYAFASSIDTVRQWVKTKGPVTVGTDWHQDMYQPNAQGYVKPTGAIVGGHEWVIVGDLVSEDAALALNSWGSNWGIGGSFKIKWADFDILFKAEGEAVAALEIP